MSNYTTVANELERGTPAELLCATCPWDRLCITPPSMTRSDIERQIRQASSEPGPSGVADEKGSAVATLMTAIMFAGKDTSAQVCPVFAQRLAGLDGRSIADGVRAQMREWKPSPGIEG